MTKEKFVAVIPSMGEITSLCIDFEIHELEEETSLERTLLCGQDINEFFKLKRRIYSPFIKKLNKEEEIKTFEDLSYLLKKAFKGLGEGDYVLLMKYLKQDSNATPLAPLDVDFPKSVSSDFDAPRGKPVEIISVPIGRFNVESGNMEIDLRHVKIEINKRLFFHVWLILQLSEEIGMCAAEDCERLFAPRKSGKPQLYCSPTCRSRQGMREFRKYRK